MSWTDFYMEIWEKNMGDPLATRIREKFPDLDSLCGPACADHIAEEVRAYLLEEVQGTTRGPVTKNPPARKP